MKRISALGIECIGSSNSFCVGLADDGTLLAARRFMMRVNSYEQKLHETATCMYSMIASTLQSADSSDSPDEFFGRGGCLAVGLTGITTDRDRQNGMHEIWKHLEFPQDQCLATGDAEVLLSGNTGSLTGAVVVCHPGSVTYARKHPAQGIRVGGWGLLMGDEGSGYYIGRKALHALTWHRDGYKDPCQDLVKAVRLSLDTSRSEWGDIWRGLDVPTADSEGDGDSWLDYLVPYSQELLERRLYRYALSDLVKAVVMAAQVDNVAKRILEHGAEHISSRFCLAVKKAGLEDQPFPLLLAGGVLVHNPLVRSLLLTEIHQQCPLAEVQPVPTDGLYHTGAGAALHALARTFNELPKAHICSKVLQATRQALR